jgi:molybdopterin/thiamine biosynthesis adenylyltransferase
MAQLIKTCLRKHNPAAMLDKCDIYVIDGDIVEEKNLSRQNFITPDVGRNKALVVAERYARAFGINVIPCTEFLTPTTRPTFDGPAGEIAFKTVFENAVVIFCVDSAKARKEILQFMNKYCTSNLFVIDAGNEDDFGQIKMFTGHLLLNSGSETKKTLAGMPKDVPCSLTTGFIPMDFEYYENLGESVSERSCADLPQTLAINTMMATLILCTLQNFMQLRPMTYDGQSYSLTGGTSTSWNTPRRWAQRVVDWDNAKAAHHNFIRGNGRINAGTALKASGDENGDIFFKLRNEAKASYKASGMRLLSSGELEQIAPPPPPEMKVVAEIPEAPVLKTIPTIEIPEAAPAQVPTAPPLARRTRTLREVAVEVFTAEDLVATALQPPAPFDF